MRVVALISGGKDSCYNMMQCVAEGHDIVALANLRPAGKDELDSYMYQTVGHHAIDLYAEAMSLPLYRRVIEGSSKVISETYEPTADDEVEDLFYLLKQVKDAVDVDAVSVGAILSDYQRVRVENVCGRLGLTCLAYLWRRDQQELLQEMITCQVSAILIKVAGLGLDPKKHLGKTLQEIYPHMVEMIFDDLWTISVHLVKGRYIRLLVGGNSDITQNQKYGLNICGEGGEYETFTLDCPLFNKTIVLDQSDSVIHSDDAFAPVSYLNLKSLHLEDKNTDPSTPYRDRIHGLPLMRSEDLLQDIADSITLSVEDTETSWMEDTKPLWTENTKSRQSRCELTDSTEVSVRVVRKVTADGQFWISGIQAVRQDGSDVSQQAEHAMNQLKDAVTQCGAEMSDVVAVSLSVQSMEDFAAINQVYKQSFGLNPPCRVCVQSCLPANITLQMDCFGCNTSRQGSSTKRKTMHVQGLSHWAPANIGPYSQAVRINNRIFVAGQIPLCPGTMRIVEGGITTQATLALRHVTRVLAAMTVSSRPGLVIGYVTHRDDIQPALRVCRSALEKRTDCGDSPVEPEALVTCVVVPQLPRQALVEWQVYADLQDVEVSEDSLPAGEVTECRRSVKFCMRYSKQPGSPLSALGHVCQLSENPSPAEVVESIFAGYKSVEDRHGIGLADLPLIRLFYSTKVLSHGQLKTALQSYFQSFSKASPIPVSLFPVIELSPPGCVVTVCH